MESILIFFEELSSIQKLAWIVGVLSFCFLLEAGIPLFKLNYKKWRHTGVNMFFLTTTIIINTLFGILTIGIFQWLDTNHFGILHLVDLPIWAELIIALLILDLVAQYFVHYLLHRVRWMWKFHLVHHSDTHVDATTGTRHHPGDYVLREVFALLAVIIAGLPFAFYMMYRILTVFTTYTTHANIRLPNWLDKTLSFVFITPNMHKFHHHFERPWTDTNFGNIFSFWDRLFGTMVYTDTKDIKYGVDVLDGTKDENIMYQMSVPFDKSIKTD